MIKLKRILINRLSLLLFMLVFSQINNTFADPAVQKNVCVAHVSAEFKTALEVDPDLLNHDRSFQQFLRQHNIRVRYMYPDFTYRNAQKKVIPRGTSAKQSANLNKIAEIEDDLRRTFLFSFSEKNKIDTIITQLKMYPYFDYVEPIYISEETVFPEDLPNDTYIKEWGKHSKGLKDIEADAAWKLFYDNANITNDPVVVAVVDNGFYPNHPDLDGQVWVNSDEIPENGIDDDDNGYIDDVNWPVEPGLTSSHGTFVAGIIAAKGNNSEGIIGVAPESKIMFLDHKKADFYSQNAIVYAAKNGAKVINCSWRGAGYNVSLNSAINYALQKGCTLIFASGNDGTDINLYYPNNSSKVISVGNGSTASSGHYTKGYNSNFGLIDCLATGAGVTSLYNPVSPFPSVIDEKKLYGTGGGTSFSAPYVSGIAALLYGLNPALTHEQVRQILRVSCDDLKGFNEDTFEYKEGFDNASGYGKVNAKKAIEFLLEQSDIPELTIKLLSKGKPTTTDQENIDGDIAIEVSFTSMTFSPDSLILEYGVGDMPESWIPLSYEKMEDSNIVKAKIDTSLKDAVYSVRVRLAVPGSIQKFYEKRARFSVKKANLMTPYPGETCGLKSKIKVLGRVYKEKLKFYKLMVGIGIEPDTFETVYIGYDGTENEYDLLGIVDLEKIKLDPKKPIVIKLVADYGETVEEVSRLLRVNKYILKGWPQKPDQVQSGSLSYTTVLDVNGDNKKEILVPFNYLGSTSYKNWIPSYSYTHPKLFVYNHSGEIVDAFLAGSKEGSGALNGVVMNKEGSKTFLFPSELNGFPRFRNLTENNLDYLSSIYTEGLVLDFRPISSCDINQDDKDEILVPFENSNGKHQLLAFDCFGEKLFSITPDNDYINTYSICRYSDSEQIKTGIVLLTKKTNDSAPSAFGLEMFKLEEGTAKIIWKKFIYEGSANLSTSYYNFFTGDLDGNESDEIVLGYNLEKAKKSFVSVYKSNGVNFWKIEKADYLRALVLADMDGDSDPEVVCLYQDSLAIYAADGSLKEEVLMKDILGDEFDKGAFHYTILLAGDCNDDGIPDLIMSGEKSLYNFEKKKYDSVYKVWALLKTGKIWRNVVLLESETEKFSYPVIADINGDSKSEIIVTAKYSVYGEYYCDSHTFINIYVLKTRGDSRLVEWAAPRYSNNATARYARNLAPEIEAISTKQISEGDFLVFSINASDPNGDVLSFKGVDLPAGAAVLPSSGIFRWRPKYDQSGVYNIKIDVSDGKKTTSANFWVRVKDAG
ncbi:MAG: S8 family serine peptidase [Candidatus Theseobacter exili]|nr:S8 family serine peptidase [Candidatus Theseobacter exili]